MNDPLEPADYEAFGRAIFGAMSATNMLGHNHSGGLVAYVDPSGLSAHATLVYEYLLSANLDKDGHAHRDRFEAMFTGSDVLMEAAAASVI